MSIKKKLLSVLSAAAVVASMTAGAASTVFAKDTGINGIHSQGETLGTFLREDYLGYESIELDYKYESETMPSYAENTFAFLVFDTNWGGWDKINVGQDNPVSGQTYSQTIPISTIESALSTDNSVYGFNLITDNFGNGEVTVNSVKLIDKAGQEAVISGEWTKGTAADMDVTGDSDIVVDANAYNIYLNGFSAYGFTNPAVKVTVEYDEATVGAYKEATLYYVDNYNTDDEVWTGVENEDKRYKEVKQSGDVTYTFQIDETCHSLFACFDACKVKKIEICDATPEDIIITGNWTMGTESILTSNNSDIWFSGNEEFIYVFNFSLIGYRSPTVEVTAEYTNVPVDGSYMQAELYSKGSKIGGSYIPVTLGTHKYTFDVSRDLTEFNVCFDGCTVTQVRIYDNRSDIPAEVSGFTASQIAANMGKAWNLGNALESTIDGIADETLWNNKFPVSKPMFDAVAKAGFKTVRIPVSYMDKIVYENGKYTVDDTYMARVKQVVDVALASGLYVVIDMHNDGGANVDGMWLDITKTGTEFNNIKTKYSAVWSNIADYFKDYDQRLLFEGFNELNNDDYDSDPTETELSNVNTLNQAFVNAVRVTGGKNTDRILIVAGYNNDVDMTVMDGGFSKPTDTSADRLMLSVHYYDPKDFALNENSTDAWNVDSNGSDIEEFIFNISDFAQNNNMPIFIGEYGAVDKNNTSARAEYCYWLNYYADNNELNVKFVTACWDNGDTNQYGFALFDRTTNTVTSTGNTLINAIMGKHK